ncbi:MAG TPA: hypothetical protein VHF06_34260 [Pseudonocardiaceae bacterium]|nr:hypothetical protein [Pseudonocardiaceae bacterium]
MADEALFAGDGTQPLPADPVLPDPLAGLVTGAVFADPVTDFTVTGSPERTTVTPATQARRRPTTGVKRPARPAATAAPPAAIPVAESLPARPRQAKQAPAGRPAAIPVTPGSGSRPTVRTTPVNRAPRSTPTPQQRTRSRQRTGSAGCSLFALIVLIIVIGFVVLGVVLGHGDGGGFGTGGG